LLLAKQNLNSEDGHLFQMSRRRAYHSHGYRMREAYKLHCQQMHHMIQRLLLRIEDPHMSLQPVQCEMHLCVSLPIHWCTTLWSKLILSKITRKTEFEPDWDKNHMEKTKIYEHLVVNIHDTTDGSKIGFKDTGCDFPKPSFPKSGLQQLELLLHL